MTGPINHHFVADIGLAFVASGTGLLLGVAGNARPQELSRWPEPPGPPCMRCCMRGDGFTWACRGGSCRISEGVGVMVVGALGAALAWLRFAETQGG